MTGGRETRMTSAYHTGDALYIHVKLLQNHKELEYDPVLDTIMKIEHTHQKPKTCLVARRYIYPGLVYKQLQYHIFRTIVKNPVAPNVKNGVDKNTIKYTNVLHNSDESKLILGMDQEIDPGTKKVIKDETRQNAEITIAMDIDTWAKKQRAEKLGSDLPDTSEWGKRTDIRTICYPLGMCKDIKNRDEKEATRLGIKIPAPQTFLTPSPAITKKRKAVVDAVGDTSKNQRVVY